MILSVEGALSSIIFKKNIRGVFAQGATIKHCGCNNAGA